MCASEPRSVKALSDALSAPMNNVHYHVKKLISLELLLIDRVVARAGRAVKFYRPVADRFFIPESFRKEPGGTFRKLEQEAVLLERAKNGEGMIVRLEGKKGIKMEPAQPGPRSFKHAQELWMSLEVDDGDVADLIENVTKLLKKFRKPKSENQTPNKIAHFSIIRRPS